MFTLTAVCLLWSGLGETALPQSLAPEAVAAFRSGEAWRIRTIDSSGNVGQYASLGLNPATGAHYIAYYDATSPALRMAYGPGTGWTSPPCNPAANFVCVTATDTNSSSGMYASLGITPNGLASIAYYNSTDQDLVLAQQQLQVFLPIVKK